jgi:hypothetical protein
MKVLLLACSLVSTFAWAGDSSVQKTPLPPEEEHWKFLLAVPGFMAGADGTAGIDGVNSNIDLGFGNLLPKIDMIWATRVEISKARFGVLGELIYLSASDGIGSDGVVKKADVRVDEYLADLTLRYRLIEGPRGYVDLLAGVRYTNLYQAVSLRPNDEAIKQAAANFTDEVSARIRERVEEVITEGRFRNALQAAISKRITNDISNITGPDPQKRSVPNAPLAYRTPGRIGETVERLAARRVNELVATASAELHAAEAAERAAAQQAVAAERARLTARAAALRSRVDQRIATAQKNLERETREVLERNLDQDVSRGDDWWDPYIGLRARYNFTSSVYVIGRGDIGGFSVGSDLMWQGEAAVGFQLTNDIYAELGYRAIGFDYNKNGLVYDMVMHGAQVTLGVLF